MKTIIVAFTVCIGLVVQAQQIDYNTQKGYIAQGYDVVSYFDNSPAKGMADFTVNYNGAKLKFTSQNNKDRFNTNPKKYLPKYGGYCSYAMAISTDKVKINPETFEIRNGELHLFYNSRGTNTLTKWLESNPDDLVKKADINWEKVKYKK